jgi:MoCo/4Fe-4S cofactor protein with predicted Tat translocation signal
MKMKTKPPLIQIDATATGPRYWRSLNELASAKEFQEWLKYEFPETADLAPEGASRRTMLQLMGASIALAGLTACSRPVENILPASKGVEDYIPGKARYYATAFPHAGSVSGLLAETHDGRPTKLEGNPDHPSSLGAASAFAQASVLDLYDPDRSKNILRQGKPSTWQAFEALVRQQFHSGELGTGKGLRFLSERVCSPSLEALRTFALQRYPEAKWVEYEPLNNDSELTAISVAYGESVEARYNFEKADVVVSLDCDFLGLEAADTLAVKQFSQRRRVAATGDTMNRLYVIESPFSITGAMADHRRRVRTADVAAFAAQLRNAVAGLNVLGADKWIDTLARELKGARGRSIVIAGPRQSVTAHLAAIQLNELLGNAGQTVVYVKTGRKPLLPGFRELAGEMARGEVSTLVMLGGNPVFTAPADLEFANHLQKLPLSIHLGVHDDETALAANWHVPEAHYLEAWSDGRAADGTASIQQPMIEPLYGGKTAAEVVALITEYQDRKAHDIVRKHWNLAENNWKRALRDGLIPGTQYRQAKLTLNQAAIAAYNEPRQPAGGMEVTFVASASVYDGRFANNAWLQEAPDPISKLVWDNAALVSPSTAQQLNVANGDVVAIKLGRASIEIPVLIQPGHADQSVTLPLGYGRQKCGRVGKGVGTDVYPIRTTAGFGLAAGAAVTKTGKTHKLATTQEHFAMEGRPIVREATLADFLKNPKFVEEGEAKEQIESLYGERKYDTGYQWGMSIDLSSCIGCNACLVACVAENNIPVVGKDQVSRGREMHWIRMDRYYVGDVNDPQLVTQPLPCQQCENAPCENVCPVAATIHSPEGLNDMAYNRCVGTRYCANNCPYKVRRFNFLNWHKGEAEVQKMVYNPDVTVRMRGVMEKCNYCVQRIEETRITANADGRRAIRDGEIKTACQQTCPADAIVFGNINDPTSRVAKLKKQERDYALLGDLDVRPRTTYLAKLTNPNPELKGTKESVNG